MRGRTETGLARAWRERLPRPSDFVALLVLPAALAFAALSLRDAGGPYWFSSNLDPSYAYLLNSLNLSNLRRPEHTDHPGTTVQAAGAALIRLSNPRADEDSTAREVVARPEFYIRGINHLLVFLCALAVLAAGYVARAGGAGLAPGLLAQTPPLLFLGNVVGLTGVRPESLLLAFSVLLGAVSLAALRLDPDRRARGVALGLGLIVGLGVATKLTFAPLVLLPLVVLPTWRSRALMSLAALAAFFLAVAPALGAAHVPDAFRLVAGVATRTDFHMHGALGPLGFKTYAWNVYNLVAANPVFFGAVAAMLSALAFDFRRLLARDAWPTALAAVCVIQVAQLLAVASYPNDLYLVPPAGLLGCGLALALRVLRERFGRARLFQATVLLLALGAGCAQFVALRNLREGARRNVERVNALLERLEDETRAAPLVEYWGASSPTFALKFGLEWNGGRYAALVEELHPGRLFYNPWERQFSTYDRRVDAARLRAHGGEFVMYGFSFDNDAFRRRLPKPFLPDGLKLRNTSPSAPRVETIYKARFEETTRAAEQAAGHD